MSGSSLGDGATLVLYAMSAVDARLIGHGMTLPHDADIPEHKT